MKISTRARRAWMSCFSRRLTACVLFSSLAWAWNGRAAPVIVQTGEGRSGLLYFKREKLVGGRIDLWVQSTDGQHHRQLTSSGRVAPFNPLLEPGPLQGAAISPDGRWVAYAERAPPARDALEKEAGPVNGWHSLWIVGSDGKGRRKLLERKDVPGIEAASAMDSFIWFPDNTSLALMRRQTARASVANYCPQVSIHRLDMASAKVTPLVVNQAFGDSQLLGWSSAGKELMVFSRCGLRQGDPALFNEFLRAIPSMGGEPRSWDASAPMLSPGGSFVYLTRSSPPNRTSPGVFDITEAGLTPVLELSPPKPGFMVWRQRAAEGLFTALDCNGWMSGTCMDSLRPRQMFRVEVSARKMVRVGEDSSRIHVLAFSPDDAQVLVSLAIQQQPRSTTLMRTWREKLYLVPSQLLLSGASWEELRRQGTEVHGFQNWKSSEHIHAYVGWVR